MIHIFYIVPYPEMEELVCQIFNNHPQKDLLDYHISVISADKLEEVSFPCDVLVGRGYTAQKMKKLMPHIPLIEIAITGYDLIQAVKECIESHHPKRIALVGGKRMLDGMNYFQGLFDCQLLCYQSNGVEEVEGVFEEAVRNGCDAVIGGYSVNRLAAARQIPATIIKTGEEAVIQGLNEAIRTVEVMRQERSKSEVFQTIAHCAQNGIVYITCNGQVEVVNRQAAQMSAQPADGYGKNLQRLFPFMEKTFKAVLKDGLERTNELHRYQEMTLTANYIPVKSDGKMAGVVVNFQDITKIQQVEAQIRKKMSEKGLQAKYHFDQIIHRSRMMENTLDMARKYAQVSSNILLVGETGTGKELMAQSIHNASNRKQGPFVAVNCAALPENLLESELFGYVEGAFTGASKGGKTGLFELAHHGTLFLDEISELPLNFQSKLLRVLQEKEVRKIGDDRVIPIDLRIIAATNQNLNKMVREGAFRQDLLYRLDILKIFVPPLRNRKEDIDALFMYYVEKYNQIFHNRIQGLTPQAKALLLSYDFRGNVRELNNIAERVCVLNQKPIIELEEMEAALFPKDIEVEPEGNGTEKQMKRVQMESERELIERALAAANYNQSEAAKSLGINRTTLWRKLKKFQME